MAILKCNMCGGDIMADPGQTYGICDSCGSTVTLPAIRDIRLEKLFNRANAYRQNNEFDRAIRDYEEILLEDISNAEAHWGLLLSRYGIEYVEDPISHERKPTCHRMQTSPIMLDQDYKAAIENAHDEYTRRIYEYEAKQIAVLQLSLMKVVNNSDKYDVFICYKETTDGGSRTHDSVIAEDIYNVLTKYGYKVFFSRITLENELGKQYEPIIFTALTSARIMLVIGTQREHFDAVWVKNEWKRYLEFSRDDNTKLLIPCYQGMAPEELPEELSMLQAQNLNNIGFMQDLLRGIRKVLANDDAERSVPEKSGHENDNSLIRARIAVEDGDFEAAKRFCEEVLYRDPECAEAYIIRLQAELRITEEENLKESEISFVDNPNYQRAIKYASPEAMERYREYCRLSEEEAVPKARVYKNLTEKLRGASSHKELLDIKKMLEGLGDYKDAKVLLKTCNKRIGLIEIDQDIASLKNEIDNEIETNCTYSISISIERWITNSWWANEYTLALIGIPIGLVIIRMTGTFSLQFDVFFCAWCYILILLLELIIMGIYRFMDPYGNIVNEVNEKYEDMLNEMNTRKRKLQD